MRVHPRIAVFCGANSGRRSRYREAASTLGRAVGAGGLGLVYGGAAIGLMGILADSALAAGGEVIGVIPRALVEREIAHRGLTELHVVSSMHERKKLIGELAGAFLALPGGLGTLDELFEVLTWKLLGIHDKPVGLLNVDGYFDGLLAMLERARSDCLVLTERSDYLLTDSDADRLLGAVSRMLGV